MCSNIRAFSVYLFKHFYLFTLDFVPENTHFYSAGRLELTLPPLLLHVDFHITKPSSLRTLPGQLLFLRANHKPGSLSSGQMLLTKSDSSSI